jgi:hypothetical protein
VRAIRPAITAHDQLDLVKEHQRQHDQAHAGVAEKHQCHQQGGRNSRTIGW